MGYLALGYGIVWLLLAVYLFVLGRRQTALRRRLEELEAGGDSSDGWES
jgi:CcmD family protein